MSTGKVYPLIDHSSWPPCDHVPTSIICVRGRFETLRHSSARTENASSASSAQHDLHKAHLVGVVGSSTFDDFDLCVVVVQTVDYVERDGTWHHLAVTWSAANHGLTQIYYDGMLSE